VRFVMSSFESRS